MFGEQICIFDDVTSFFCGFAYIISNDGDVVIGQFEGGLYVFIEIFDLFGYGFFIFFIQLIQHVLLV